MSSSLIHFNVPPFLGTEFSFMYQASENHKICGDGVFTKKCDEWLENRFNAKKVMLTTSGTAALEMAAWLCDLQAGDEVILPSYTFSSTATAFALVGAKLVFVDIRPDTMNINEKLIEAAITPKTRVIVCVHYAGVACEMDTIMDIARRHKLKVVEDAAQAVMSTYKGKYLGTIGDFGCYSFHETKNYSMGEGGAIVINEESSIERAEILREKGTNRSKFFRGQVAKYNWVDWGSSYLPSDLNAAYLWAQLQQADVINDNRLQTWNTYNNALKILQEKNIIDLPYIPAECVHNAHMYYIKCSDLSERTNFIDFMKNNNILCVFHYVPLHSAPAGIKFGRFVGEDKYTTAESDRLVRLPLYYNMQKNDLNYVIDKALEFFGIKHSLTTEKINYVVSKKTKVIHFSAMDNGGAGIAAVRYHKLMQEMGFDSTLYVKNKTNLNDDSIVQISVTKEEPENLLRVRETKLRYCYYDFRGCEEDGLVPDILSQIDTEDVSVVFIHWLGDFINSYDIKNIYEATKARFIFSMMDMEPITGGCHYAWECKEFKTHCLDCSALPIKRSLLSHNQLMTKTVNYTYINADIFSSSYYDLDSARSSMVHFNRYYQLYYPIDEHIFSAELINHTDITLFSNVNNVKDPRKGFNYLLAVLINLDKRLTKRVRFLTLPNEIFKQYRFNNIYFEEFQFKDDVNALANLYQQTDIFLCASIEDAAPMMLQEALLCGVPAITFDVGVGKQFIEEGRQRYVVPRYDVKNFEQKLYEMIEKRPSSIQSALEIHNHMVSICGKDIVKQKLYDILTGTTIRKWGGVTHNKEIFKLSTLSYAPSYKEAV